MKIIETMDDFTAMVESSSFMPSFMIPILSDVKAHPAVNPLSVLFLSQLDGEKYVLLFDHNEGDKLPDVCKQLLIDRLNVGHRTIFVPDKKAAMHVLPLSAHQKYFDMVAYEYLATGNVFDADSLVPQTLRSFQNRFWKFPHMNRAAPLMKLIELCEAIVERFTSIMQTLQYDYPGFEFLNDIMIPVMHFMEAGGVCVDREKFVAHYGEKANSEIKGNLVFTQYNPYTAAGRVTNKHGGINYAAINKHDGTREAFISRNGSLVMIDWESFHLRLIANMIGYPAPKEPFHEYLAKQYFNTTQPTPEEYEEGKKITFQNLYSRHQRQNIPFFNAVTEWEDKAWALFELQGRITLPGQRVIWKNRMEDPSPSKMFNYILQWMETYTAFRLIVKLMPLYRTARSKVILYTYDSLLIDWSWKHDPTLIDETIRVLEDGGKFPVRVYQGPNYNKLVKVNT